MNSVSLLNSRSPLFLSSKLTTLILLVLVLGILRLNAQQSATYLELVKKIQAEEIKFPFPQKDTLILMGEIIPAVSAPGIKFFIPYTDVKFRQVRGHVEPDLRETKKGEKPGDFIVGTQNITDTNRIVIAGNHFHMRLRFKVGRWLATSPTITASVGSQTKIIKRGDKEVIFDDILDTDPIVNCYYPATTVTGGNPSTKIEVIFRNVLHIHWDLAGAGLITLPVLPVKIIYAPVADYKGLNSSSISETSVKGYATNISVTSSSSNSKPVPTSLSKVDDFLAGFAQIGQAMEKNEDPDVAAVGKAINVICTVLRGGLGSQTITETVSNSQTEQNSVAVSASQTDQVTASADHGGPGEGDVIAFYLNAQFVWYADKGRLHLMMLGYEPELKTPTARQLKKQLASLRGKPAGTKDSKWHIDAKSLAGLLSLDPFTGPNGAFSQPDPKRFTVATKLDGSAAVFQNGGAKLGIAVSHQVTTTDSHSTAEVRTSVEVDKPGFLSFLGGPSEDKTIQLVYSKSVSSQYTTGQTVTGAFTLNGDGNIDHYHCQVFFDNVFGTFAFRDHSLDVPDKK